MRTFYNGRLLRVYISNGCANMHPAHSATRARGSLTLEIARRRIGPLLRRREKVKKYARRPFSMDLAIRPRRWIFYIQPIADISGARLVLGYRGYSFNVGFYVCGPARGFSVARPAFIFSWCIVGFC